MARLVEQYVLRLEITMHYAHRVQVLERVDQLARQPARATEVARAWLGLGLALGLGLGVGLQLSARAEPADVAEELATRGELGDDVQVLGVVEGEV